MVYAISGLGDDSACDLIPGSDKARSGRWAEMRSKYGCPERIYPFWFYPGAPTFGLSTSETWFLSPLTEEGTRAQSAWRSKHPSDWYTPPYVVDMGSPDIKSGTQTVVPVKFWEGIPSTPIPCQCTQSPGFSDCAAKVMESVASKCSGNKECIGSNFANLSIMTGCATLCKSGTCSDAKLTPEDKKLIDDLNKGASSVEAAKSRSRSLMMYGAAGIVAYVLWKRSQKRR
jgi:hypothetical protein